MVRHKKLYLKFWGYGEQDLVPSEYSGLRAEHIHHLKFRSKGGTDDVWNTMALTGKEHDRAHEDPKFNLLCARIHAEKLRLKGYENWDRILQELREAA